MQTIREKLQAKSNDYSCFEPFNNYGPISTSIIIPVYGEERLLEDCLLALKLNSDVQGNKALVEVVIVNDGGDPEVEKNISVIMDDIPITYIYCKNNLGRSIARNIGIKTRKATQSHCFCFCVSLIFNLISSSTTIPLNNNAISSGEDLFFILMVVF